jgi:hypothetical protein
MANTVAYNNGSNPVGSIKKGVVSINIDNSLITSGHTWRNGIEIVNQYIIYSDTYTQGIDTQQNAKPCAWSCAYNDASLLNLINSLPPLIGQPKYDTLATAIAWLEGQNKYFLVNQSYPEIVTSGMTLCLDAGMTGSYPNAGTTWYDLSGYNNNVTLTNGPSWTSSQTSSYITFDGSDDYGRNDSPNLPTGNVTATICAWIYVVSGYGDWQGIAGWGDAGVFSNSALLDMNQGRLAFSTWGYPGAEDLISTYNVPKNIWKFVVGSIKNKNIKLYADGVKVLDDSITSTPTVTSTKLRLATTDYPGRLLNTRIANVQIYNRELSQSEILQNYYKGKLVTSGLTLALDAGNLVSYGGNGTTWYDMTSNANNGTLTNGPVYSGGTVPSLVFDGTNDYVSLPQSLLPNNFTYSIWVMRDGEGNQGTRGIVISNGSTYIDVGFQNNIMFSLMLSGGTQNLIQSANGVIAPFGVWGHYTATYNQEQAKLYYNGVEVGSSNYTLPPTNDFNTFIIGAYAGGGYNLNGKISNAQYYNRALSASEISQNFNTYRRRYGI